jgi:hypothetical protein
MKHVLITIGHHGTAPIPPSPSHNVNGVGKKRVGGAHNGTDVEIVLPIFNRDVKRVTVGV